jgi:hypothetical protein
MERPELLPRRRLVIGGVELTQSIQHHGAAGTSFGDDNSIPLVALKDLVARVYPQVRPGVANPDALSGQRVTGELVLSVGDRVVYRTGPTRPAGARVGPRKDLTRTLWDEELTFPVDRPGQVSLELHKLNSPLNFQVPGWYCRRGRIFVSLRVWRAEHGPSSTDSAFWSDYVEFLDVPAPRVCLVRVNWTDSAGRTTRQTDEQMLATLRLSERMLPFPYFETTILGVEESSTAAFAMVAADGGCNTAWNDLLARLAVTRIFTALFGLGDIVFGMVPQAAIPPTATTINSGCGSPASAGNFVGLDGSFAHEFGHVYNRPHLKDDPAYPHYGGDRRSIGEVGIDTGTSPPTLFDPATSDDIMVPDVGQWISPHTYRRILDDRALHRSAPADPRRVRPLLFLHVRLHRLRRVEVRRSIRLEAAGSVGSRWGHNTSSPLSLDLLDREGGILRTHHLVYVPHQAAGQGCCACAPHVPLERESHLDMQEVLEWPVGVAAVAFHRGEEPLATMDVGDAPTVEITGPDRTGDRLEVRIRAAHPRETPSVVLLFTADDGLSWQPMAFDPPDGVFSVEQVRLPGGDRCRFRALATAELEPAMAETETFELPRTGRRLYVVTPDDECGISAGPVALRALVDCRGLGAVPPQHVRWQSSLEGEIGVGLDLVAHLGEGRHDLTVTAPDGLGGTLSERGIIIVGG